MKLRESLQRYNETTNVLKPWSFTCYVMFVYRVATVPPHVTDVDWRLDYFLKVCVYSLYVFSLPNYYWFVQDNHVERVNRAEYIIQVKVCNYFDHVVNCYVYTINLLQSSSNETLQFAATQEQVQVLIYHQLGSVSCKYCYIYFTVYQYNYCIVLL